MRIRAYALAAFAILISLQVAAAQVPPDFKPFSADMEITSVNGQSGSRDMSGKVYVTREHMRMEVGAGGPTPGVVSITNFKTKTADMIMPAQQMYMEFSSDQATGRRPGPTPAIRPILDPNNPCADEPDMTCKNLGVEDVNGRACDHWRMTDKNGRVNEIWVDQKLHFPIKTITPGSSWQLTNIKEGEQDASLFEIPAGYRKMDMGQMMQGRRGIQGTPPPQQ
jgi:hypothetical protein